MILLIEGVLPQGYFCGSLSGLQADMAVFRELLSTKLPKLSRHLQKLQGTSVEDSFEPPLTNVFTMQWFLTLFCTCLPISCVLRVWDLILIEGSDILLRAAITIWSLMEDRILSIRSADDFYCKMGLLSGEILNGNLIDSNGLIQRVVDMGPIEEVKKLREKHLYNISPWRDKKGILLYYSDDECESDDDSRLAVTTAWGLRGGRRSSLGQSSSTNIRNVIDNKDRLALDISLLKQQYTKLRERQRQAHIILTAACARQGSNSGGPAIQMNQFLMGRNAILNRKGRRIGPPPGSIPPARKIHPPHVHHGAKGPKPVVKTKKIDETLHWKDTDADKKRRNSLKWKDIKGDKVADESETGSSKEELGMSLSATSSQSNISEQENKTSPMRNRSESSSYSDESDSSSSTSTSLCDDENLRYSQSSSVEQSPIKKKLSPDIEVPEFNKNEEIQKYIDGIKTSFLSPSNDNIFGEEETKFVKPVKDGVDEEASDLLIDFEQCLEITASSPTTVVDQTKPLVVIEAHQKDNLSPTNKISSISQLSPIPDISTYISMSNISPLRTPSSSTVDYSNYITDIHHRSNRTEGGEQMKYAVNEEGVTNEFFERVNLDRPTKLDISEKYEPMKIIKRSPPQPTHELPYLTTPILPPCTDISSISIDRSPIIATAKSEEDDLVYDIKSSDRLMFLNKKSVSLDEPTKDREHSFRPTSCPEPRGEPNLIAERNSDKVLKIIQENSMILHRILKKNSTQIDDESSEHFTKLLKATEDLLDDKLCFEEKLNTEKECSESFSRLLKETEGLLDQTEKEESPRFDPEQHSSENFGRILKQTEDLLNSKMRGEQKRSETFAKLFKKSTNDSFEGEHDNLNENISTEQKRSEVFEKLFKSSSSSSSEEQQQFSGDDKPNLLDIRSDRERSETFSKIFKSNDDLMNEINAEIDGDGKKDGGEPEYDDDGDVDEDESKDKVENLRKTPELIVPDREMIEEKLKRDEEYPNTLSAFLKDSEMLLEGDIEIKPNMPQAISTEEIIIKKEAEDISEEVSKLLDSIESEFNTDDDLVSKCLVMTSSTENPMVNMDTPEIKHKTNEMVLPNLIGDLLISDEKRTIEEKKVISPEDNLNISKTLTSIEQTIKSINQICKTADDERNIKYQTIIECAKLEPKELKEGRHYEKKSSFVQAPPSAPSINLIDCDMELNDDLKKNYERFDNDSAIRSLSVSRMTRDIKREPSPRRRKYDYIEECVSRAERSASSYEKILDRIENDSSSSNSDYKKLKYPQAGSIGYHNYDVPHRKPPEKPEIRHTTVTCTFYDRYLLQKQEEKNIRLDSKSPEPLTSPMITKSYLESLRPDRVTKSAENSPSRNKFESNLIVKPISIVPPFDYRPGDSISHVKSCDNIMEKFDKERNGKPFSYMPIRKREPTEVGLKLGMYKNSSPTS